MPKKEDKKTTDVEEVNLDTVEIPLLDEEVEIPDEIHFEKLIEGAAKKAKGDIIDEEGGIFKKAPPADFEDFDEHEFKLVVSNDDEEEEEEDFDEEEEEGENEDGTPKKRERGLSRMPVDRNQDKRRIGKGLQKFIDVTVPEEYLAGLSEDMQLLFKKGKLEGKITHDELARAMPNAEENLDLLDEIYTRLLKLQVDVVDTMDSAVLLKGKSEEKASEIDLSEISDDSIRMYLNEIGRFSLIDAEEEVRLGRLIKK